MGCDIHMYLEYKSKEGESKHWRGFGGRINPGRNYNIFARLAGVRGQFENSLEPKGLPENMGYSSSDDSRMFISESEGDNYVTPERAAKWVEEGSSTYIDNQQGEHVWVTHPDWHSHSWVTLEEYSKVMAEYRTDTGNNEPEYEAIGAALQSMENNGYVTRIVFWFDN